MPPAFEKTTRKIFGRTVGERNERRGGCPHGGRLAFCGVGTRGETSRGWCVWGSLCSGPRRRLSRGGYARSTLQCNIIVITRTCDGLPKPWPKCLPCMGLWVLERPLCLIMHASRALSACMLMRFQCINVHTRVKCAVVCVRAHLGQLLLPLPPLPLPLSAWVLLGRHGATALMARVARWLGCRTSLAHRPPLPPRPPL